MTAPETSPDSERPQPRVASRVATLQDAADFVRLYRLLEAELAALKPIWPLTEGLAEPVEHTFAGLVADPRATVLLGTIDHAPVGFLVGRSERLLPQAGAERIGVVRFIFTETPAREVGIAEAMMGRFVAESRSSGHRLFDAHVSPGHRIAKNFFEANGFKARHIVMHRDERPDT